MISEILAFASLILMSLVSLYSVCKLKRFEELGDSLDDLLRYEEDEDGQPQLDVRLVKMMKTFGSAIATSTQMSILGKLSGPARLDKGLKGAMAADAAENAMPLLGLVGDIFGINTTKYIKNHPDAMMQLIADPRIQNFIGSVMGGQRNNHSSGQGVM